MLGDGSALPSHGIYGAATDWQEWSLGDFTLTDSPVADFINAFPTTAAAGKGQISAYDVHVAADSSVALHFDLYDHVGSANHVKFSFAPFSHDAQGESQNLPEPASMPLLMALLGIGWVRLALAARRNKQ
jgi:hypothetical protein